MMLLLVLTGLTAGSALSAQDKKEERREAVHQLVTSKNYEIEVNLAQPLSGHSINLTTPYSLTVRGDSVISYLPYYGRAYSVPYGGGKGLNFSAPVSNYRMTPNAKKGSYRISFTTKSDEDTYQFRLTVFDSGSASVDVSMQNRQSISFQGDLKL
jgi:hypothetical protein